MHRSGAASRAQLTRLTGLNRSTIAALVVELAELGLVEEREPDPTNQVGRPSPIVAVSERVVALAVNPEIDAVTIGIVGLDGVVHRCIRHSTERSPSVTEAVNIAAAVIDGMRGELESTFRVVGIGVAVPGLVCKPHDLLSQFLIRHGHPTSITSHTTRSTRRTAQAPE